MDEFLRAIGAHGLAGVVLVGALTSACHGDETLERVAVLDGFATPESAYFEPRTESWFVSNISGDDPGDGFIRRLNADGGVEDDVLVAGLNDPKGIRVHGGTLYTADVTDVAVVKLAHPERVARIAVPGAIFLNDVAVDETTGDVYVSDTIASAIYRVRGRSAELVLKSPELEAPNGLLVERGFLLIAGAGPDLDPNTLMTSAPGRVLALNLRTLELVPVSERIGLLDGLERDGADLLVSDLNVGLYRVAPNGTATKILDDATEGFGSSADIGFDPLRRRLAIPELTGSRVGLYDFVPSDSLAGVPAP